MTSVGLDSTLPGTKTQIFIPDLLNREGIGPLSSEMDQSHARQYLVNSISQYLVNSISLINSGPSDKRKGLLWPLTVQT